MEDRLQEQRRQEEIVDAQRRAEKEWLQAEEAAALQRRAARKAHRRAHEDLGTRRRTSMRLPRVGDFERQDSRGDGADAEHSHDVERRRLPREDSEFAKIASVFGIWGQDPDIKKYSRMRDYLVERGGLPPGWEAIADSPITAALTQVMRDEVSAEARRGRCWSAVCQDIIQSALRKLRNSRRALKYRAKKRRARDINHGCA